MKQVYKLDPKQDAPKIDAIEKRLVENSTSDHPSTRNLASWEVCIYNGLLYERTVGGEIWHVVMG